MIAGEIAHRSARSINAYTFLQSGAGAKKRTAQNKARDTISVKDFGAVGDGVTDDTAAVNAALVNANLTGRPVSGLGLTYAVSGNITLPAIADIRDAAFRQLTPNSTSRRTLYQLNGTLCHLVNVKVDRNGTGAYGSVQDAAGIYISATNRVILDNVEVTGSDYGNGIVCVDCDDVRMVNPYVHDMTHGTNATADPGDDRMQGVWLIRGNRAVIIAPRVQNLKAMWSGHAAFNRWTRGIAVSGTKNWTIVAPEIDNVDQGIDISGDENPEFFAVLGGTASNCYTWGYKCANSVQNGQFLGCLAYRCGIAGFVASAPSVVMSDLTQKIDYIGCRSIGSGYGGVWQASSNVCGFRAMSSVQYPDYPRGVRWIGCTADADGATMEYGFMSDVALGGDGDVWVEAVDCSSHGHTVDDYYGLSQGVALRQRSATFSVPNSAWTAIDWDNTTVNRMGATVGTASEIYIRRSGLYMVSCGVEFAGNATGTRGLRLQRNGSTLAGAFVRISASDTNNKAVTVSSPVLCNSGDLLSAQALQESGGALNILGGSALSAALIASGMGQ